MKNIFDLKNLNDLTAEVIKQLAPIGYGERTLKILSLFNIKSELSVDEIIVGLFRKYQIEVKRIWLASTLYNLKRTNKIREIKKEGKKTYGKL